MLRISVPMKTLSPIVDLLVTTTFPLIFPFPLNILARAKLHRTPVTTETSRGCRTPDDKIGL